MCKRFFYAIRMAFRYRSVLKNYRTNPTLQIANVQQLDLNRLKEQGIKVLVLDFDGVLASHGELAPAKELESWLKACITVFGSKQLFILTNKPTSNREQYFAKYYPEIQFTKCRRKKPYPEGLQGILSLSNTAAQEVLVVDDRLLTGILVAAIVGTEARWLTIPRVNLRQRPLQELFFMLLRKMERWVFK
jgi:predicted HAD superfamily phosphohydrolase YqeG